MFEFLRAYFSRHFAIHINKRTKGELCLSSLKVNSALNIINLNPKLSSCTPIDLNFIQN